MKATILALLVTAACCSAQTNTIIFTNVTASFTDIAGKEYKNVDLVKADLDGIQYRIEGGGGKIIYTNLSPSVLARFHIPTNRIEISAKRAEYFRNKDKRWRDQQAATAARPMSKEDIDALDAARQRDAEQKAMANRISALRQQIANADKQNRYADAVTPTGAAGDAAYVDAVMQQRAAVNVQRERINDAADELKRLEAEYAKKYGDQ